MVKSTYRFTRRPSRMPRPPSHRTLKTTMPEHAPILPVIAAEVAALAPVSAP